MSDFILLRSQRKIDDNGKMNLTISVVKKSPELDLSKHSFLCSDSRWDEWVPTEELHLYQKVMSKL